MVRAVLRALGILSIHAFFWSHSDVLSCHFTEQNLYRAVTRDDSDDQESGDSIVSPSFSFFEYQAQPADALPQIVEEKEAHQ